MEDISIFRHPEFGEIRTKRDEKGEPWFVGKDVASALGYKDASRAISDHVDEEDKTTLVIHQSGSNYKSKTSFINESGLYSLIFASKLRAARRFKRWVTSEVLPQIRRTGGYIPLKEGDTEEDIMERAMEVMERTIEEKNRQIEAMKPKARYFDEAMKSVSAYPVRVIAHTLQMTAQELNRFLCEHGVQYGQSGSYVPYAPYARRGYTKSRTFCRHLEDGTVETQHRTSWTERGIQFIVNLVNEERMKALPKVRMVQLTFQF